MSVLKVARMGHPVLRQRAKALDPTEIRSATIQKLVDDMFQTMEDYQGIGLAAPQVFESVRLFVAGYDTAEGERGVPRIALINPEITVVDNTVADDWEGCLSIPDIRGRVPRPREIRVRAYDRHARPIELKARGYTARVIQHETDHLDGILFFDRMKSFETLTYLEEFARYWGEDEDEVPPE